MSEEYNDTLLAKAMSHVKDMQGEFDDLPDRDDDEEGHNESIRAIHAHTKMVDDCLEKYRSAVGMDDHDVGEGDPEAGSTEEKRRARRIRQLRSST
jgi:hypothetical protein